MPKSMLCIIFQSMANSKTATIVFKGEDQISPAIKGATASVAGLSKSFEGVENASNKTAVQIKSELTKAIAAVNNELANLSKQKLTPDVQLNQQQALQQLEKLKKQLKDVDKLVIVPEVKTSGLKKAIDEIKTGISREIGAQIAQGLAVLPSAIAQTTLQFEKLQTTLKSTLGSESAANEAFATIKAFAATTPFQVSEVTESFIKLQNRGIQPSTKLLKQLGDIASSQGKSLNQITEAILDASTGEFERLKEFGIQATKAGDQVTIAFKGTQQTVANTPEAINKAIASLGDLQGVAGGTEAQSKTLGGALSNLQDTADTLAVAFGEGLTPVLLEIVKGFSSTAGESEGLARSLGQNVGSSIKFLVDNSGTLKTILELLVIQFGLVKVQALAASIATAASGSAALGAAGGFTALGLAIGSLTAALAPLAIAFATVKGIEFAKFANDLKGFNEELDIATAGSTAEGNAAFRLAERLRNVNEQRKQGKIINEQQRQGLLKLADEEIKVQQQRLASINALKPANEEQKTSQAVRKAGIETTIRSLEKQKKALAENVAATKDQAATAKRSSEDIEAAAKKRLDAERRSLEEGARLRARDFDAKAKTESGDFEKQARTEKQTFERSLNEEKRAFDNAQKADKDKFEKQLQVDQRQFNEGEKAKDAQFQKSKQDLERAFNAEQQAAKEAFDKRQQEATRAFDAKQNAEKITADAQFAQRRLEIERKLQLEAAKPEDRAKLEAEFKAADEKAAREKEAFAQLKADEEAFAKKQQADKQAFEDAQKLAAQDFEKQQQAAKLAFDDQLKARDIAFEQQKEAAKLAFEDTLKAKRDALEAGQNTAKLAFEDAIAAKRQAFEDAERAKKDAFDTAQNEKKAAFEDSERAKKQAFEDNLKTLEAQFKAQERAKDLENARQVAAIKNSGAANAVVGLASSVLGSARPLATGGRFSQGEQLLVGEKGAELVTFGTSGFVTDAANTKQILQSNTAPNSVSTARMEALLNQIAGKLDRPSTNYQIQTSESPLDAALKLERESARMRALNSGI